jgi:hypothetical protein
MLHPSPPTKEAKMLRHRVDTLFAPTIPSDPDVSFDAVMPKWFTDAVSLAIGIGLTGQSILAGAPIVESLLGGMIAGVGVFVICMVGRMGEHRIFAALKRLGRLPIRRALNRGAPVDGPAGMVETGFGSSSAGTRGWPAS